MAANAVGTEFRLNRKNEITEDEPQHEEHEAGYYYSLGGHDPERTILCIFPSYRHRDAVRHHTHDNAPAIHPAVLPGQFGHQHLHIRLVHL